MANITKKLHKNIINNIKKPLNKNTIIMLIKLDNIIKNTIIINWN